MHRVLTRGGRVGFRSIVMSPGLSGVAFERMMDLSPQSETAGGFEKLMAEAGFSNIEVFDITEEFARTVTGWKKTWEELADQMIPLIGQDEHSERILRRKGMLQAIENGWVSRQLVLADA